MFNSILFASDEVIKAMAEFVKKPTHISFIKTASAMRKDLWGIKSKISDEIIKNFALDTLDKLYIEKLYPVAKERLTENQKPKTENGL